VEELIKKAAQMESKTKMQEAIKKPTDKAQEELEGEIEKLGKQEQSLRKLQTQIESKAGDYQSILEGKACPTCDRPVKPGEFHSKLKDKEREAKKVTAELKKCVELLETAGELLEKRRDYDDAQEKLVELRDKHSEYAKDIEERKEKIQELEDDIKEAKRKLESAKKSIEELRELKTKLEEAAARMTTVEKRLKQLGEGLAARKATVQNLTKEVGEYQEQINKKEALKKKTEGLKEHQIWIEDYFLPTLDMIEKHVMLSINQDFNAHFQRWFGALVEDPGKEARVDEEFTPVIEQDGYEQDVSYLSGGEKTSVALAYRLALNTLVKKVSTGMRSNLLILDEPTDGFSKEQLGKVREILDELDCPQTVIVSHERELESFADQIFRVSKSQGESTIVAGGS
jgi:exonuclease SbcC